MSILAAATSRADFYTVGTTAANTTAAHLAPYAKEGVSVDPGTPFARFVFPSAVSDCWIRFHMRVRSLQSAGNLSGTPFRIKSGEAGISLFQLDYDSASLLAMEYWNGSAYVEVNEITPIFAADTLYKIDIQLKLDNSVGIFRIYVNDTLVWEYTGDTIFTAATTVDTIELASGNIVGTTSDFVFSGLILADEDTRSMVFHQGQATANGADTAWTGVYTDVTKLDRNDNTFIESGTAAQLETYVMDDVHTDLAAFVPRAVVLSTRTRRGATGPQNMQGVVRQSGTDFMTSNIAGINTAYGTRQAVMNTNPATSAAWTISEINAAEFGVKSIA